jgi:hypothetical protein
MQVKVSLSGMMAAITFLLERTNTPVSVEQDTFLKKLNNYVNDATPTDDMKISIDSVELGSVVSMLNERETELAPGGMKAYKDHLEKVLAATQSEQ